MEINAEINKVFGQEMAKLFAQSISEEELKSKASIVWNKLNQKRTSWDNSSEIDELIRKKMTENLKEEVDVITSSDEFKEEMKAIAKTMVKEIVDETHKKIVDEVSNRMMLLSVGHTKSGEYSSGLHSIISDVVNSMIRHK